MFINLIRFTFMKTSSEVERKENKKTGQFLHFFLDRFSFVRHVSRANARDTCG